MLVNGRVTAVVPLGNVSMTVAPPAGANSFRTTVPVEDWPGAMVGGLKKISATVGGGGVTISVTVCMPVPSVAVIVTLCTPVTGSVVTTNVAVVLPATTVTVGAICTADKSELISETLMGFPPGAAAESVTVPVVFCPPTSVFCPATRMLAGSVTLTSVGGATTVKVAVGFEVLRVAVIVAITGAAAAVAEHVIELPLHTVNVWLTEPGDTSTLVLVWNPTEGSLLVSATSVPPGGAGPDKVTVPVEFEPSTTVVGFRIKALMVSADAATTVSDPVCVLVPTLAVMLTICVVGKALVVVIGKEVKVLPVGTTTLAGTVAAALLLDSITGTPPCGAVAEMVIVPVLCKPAVIDVGFTLKEVTLNAVVITLSTTLCVTAFRVPWFCVAEIRTSLVAGTTIVEIMNCAVVAPAGMVTLAANFGTVTVSLAKSVIGIPPLGAGMLSVTVPVVAVPPTTGFG